LKGPDKRREIIQAALELIAEHGFHGAPMSMIAEKAGVAAGTIYLYFSSKDSLINEMYVEIEEDAIKAVNKGYDCTQSIREKFIYLGTKLLKHFIEKPLHFRYIEQYHNSPYGVSLRRDKILGQSGSRNLFNEIFIEGVSRQTLKDLPMPALFALAFGPMIFLARDHILGLALLDEDMITRSIEACWDSIKRTEL
jgi:TetR/AcrR family transcriptional regulator, repressor of fatR-cypB operon